MIIDVFEVIHGVMDKVFSTLPEEQKEQRKKDYAVKLEELKKKPKDSNEERMLLYQEVSKMVEGWGIPQEKLHTIVALGSSANAYEVIIKLLLEQDDEAKLKKIEEQLKLERAEAYDNEMKALAKRRSDLINQIGIARQDSLDKNTNLIKHDGQVESLMNEKAHHEELVAWIRDQITSYTKEKDAEIAALRLQMDDPLKSQAEKIQINQQILLKDAEKNKQLEEMQLELNKSSDRLLEIQATLTNLEPKSHELKDAAEQADEKLNSHYREEAEILRQQMNLAKSFGNTEGIRECEIRNLEIQQEKSMAELTKNNAKLDINRTHITKTSEDILKARKLVDDYKATGKSTFNINRELKRLDVLEKQLSAQQAKEKELLDKGKALTTSIAESQEKISKLTSSSAADNPKDKEVKNTTEMVQEYIGEFSKEEFSDRFKDPDPSASVDQKIAGLRAGLSREIQLSMDTDLKQLKTEEEKELYYKSLDKSVKKASRDLPEKKDKEKGSKNLTIVVPGADDKKKKDDKPTIVVPAATPPAPAVKDDGKEQRTSSKKKPEKPPTKRADEEDRKHSEQDSFKDWLASLINILGKLLFKTLIALGAAGMVKAAASAIGTVKDAAKWGTMNLVSKIPRIGGPGSWADKKRDQYREDTFRNIEDTMHAAKQSTGLLTGAVKVGLAAVGGAGSGVGLLATGAIAGVGKIASLATGGRIGGKDSKFYKPLQANLSVLDGSRKLGVSGLADATVEAWKHTKDAFGGIKYDVVTDKEGKEHLKYRGFGGKYARTSVANDVEPAPSTPDSPDKSTKKLPDAAPLATSTVDPVATTTLQSSKMADLKTAQAARFAELEQRFETQRRNTSSAPKKSSSMPAFSRHTETYPSSTELADMSVRGERKHSTFAEAHPDLSPPSKRSRTGGTLDTPLFDSDIEKDKKKTQDLRDPNTSPRDDNDPHKGMKRK